MPAGEMFCSPFQVPASIRPIGRGCPSHRAAPRHRADVAGVADRRLHLRHVGARARERRDRRQRAVEGARARLSKQLTADGLAPGHERLARAVDGHRHVVDGPRARQRDGRRERAVALAQLAPDRGLVLGVGGDPGDKRAPTDSSARCGWTALFDAGEIGTIGPSTPPALRKRRKVRFRPPTFAPQLMRTLPAASMATSRELTSMPAWETVVSAEKSPAGRRKRKCIRELAPVKLFSPDDRRGTARIGGDGRGPGRGLVDGRRGPDRAVGAPRVDEQAAASLPVGDNRLASSVDPDRRRAGVTVDAVDGERVGPCREGRGGGYEDGRCGDRGDRGTKSECASRHPLIPEHPPPPTGGAFIPESSLSDYLAVRGFPLMVRGFGVC